MPFNELTMRKLTALHDRWLELKDRYRPVFHCCVRQDEPVRLYEKPDPRQQKVVELGNITADVFSRAFLLADDSEHSQFQFEPAGRANEFRRSLYRGLWKAASLRCLTPLDTVWSNRHTDDSATPIVLPNQDGRWFGVCIFEKSWEDPAVSVQDSNWYEDAGTLAAESLLSFDIRTERNRDHSRLLEAWMAHAYGQLGFEVCSRSVTTDCIDLTLAGFTGGPRGYYLVGFDNSACVCAEVSTSLTWLNCDIATASARVIEMLHGNVEPHHETGTIYQIPQPDFDADQQTKTIKRERGKRTFDATKVELIRRILAQHHVLGDGTVNRTPLTSREIEERTDKQVSDSTARRFLIKHFGNLGRYRRSCQNGSIEIHIKTWTDGLASLQTIDTSLLAETLDSSGRIGRPNRRSKPVDDD